MPRKKKWVAPSASEVRAMKLAKALASMKNPAALSGHAISQLLFRSSPPYLWERSAYQIRKAMRTHGIKFREIRLKIDGRLTYAAINPALATAIDEARKREKHPNPRVAAVYLPNRLTRKYLIGPEELERKRRRR
ncbi:MAG: hypothetical protein EON58_02100 [Alphaproteobacteria bacterium]|nr:MAG: hypothetical protein EON58_02100 [Alphaproteobacteria bacterium]